jgi:hypothetical protein
MPADASEIAASSIARFNKPGRELPRMGERGRGDNEGAIKPRLAKAGYVRFLSLRDLDQRSRAAMRCKELVGALSVDLGGADRLSAAQQQLVQRSALMGTLCEDFEVRFALGEPIELLDYITVANAQRRLLVTLGLQRQVRDIGSSPSLSEYLRARSAPEEVVVGMNGVQAEPVVEVGLQLGSAVVSSADVEARDESEAPAGRVPASSPESRTGDAPQSQPAASGEASSSTADKPGNGGAP